MKKQFYEEGWFILMMLVVFFPVGVFLMWRFGKFHILINVFLSIILGIWFLFVLLFWSVMIFVPSEPPSNANGINQAEEVDKKEEKTTKIKEDEEKKAKTEAEAKIKQVKAKEAEVAKKKLEADVMVKAKKKAKAKVDSGEEIFEEDLAVAQGYADEIEASIMKLFPMSLGFMKKPETFNHEASEEMRVEITGATENYLKLRETIIYKYSTEINPNEEVIQRFELYETALEGFDLFYLGIMNEDVTQYEDGVALMTEASEKAGEMKMGQ